MSQLRVVGTLVPNGAQRTLIQEARECDLGRDHFARIRYLERYDHKQMKAKAEAEFFDHEMANAICSLIFNPQQRHYATKSLRYQQ